MASPGIQHCVNCIGTLSFPMFAYKKVKVAHTRLPSVGFRS